MGTTALGTRYADPSDPDNVPSTTKNLAEDVDLRSVPAFTTTQLRDAGMQPASNGRMCVMVPPGGAPYLLVRSGGAWVEPARLGFGAMEMSSANAQGIADNAWRACNWSSTDYFEGAGLGARAEGVSISQTGRYLVTAWVAFDKYGSGRRAIGVGPASGAGPTGITAVVPNAPANNSQVVDVTDELTFTAGQVVTAWVLQDSGVPINITNRRLKVRRVG
ncbi:hypothetical protein [Nakamurella aerolata]|uniref:Uncharacterized protein n=1 Tax=Nakamurella aerolata TaxID=1656892 RepID=A0A849ACP2_9ACTN|nr:hypothetical protein [Nakamurella aerolata]NNG36951.1 hypothetical protein [Nakamurella aerolata]